MNYLLKSNPSFRELKDKFTRIPGKDGTGAIVASTDAMSTQEALGIAKELVHISHIVAAEHHRLELLD